MLRYMFDTNICIYASKGMFPALERRLVLLKKGEACVSAITYGELLRGVEKSTKPSASKAALERIIYYLPVIPIEESVATHYAHIRALLERKGAPISANDQWIGAHALAENLTLITNNERVFKRIPKLKVENWTK
jgi:tRNA(fMet)-specific endonuclease VapC